MEVKKFTTMITIYEICIAVSTALTAGSGISHISVFPNLWAGQLTASLAVIAAVLSAIKPTFTRYINTRLARYSKKYSDCSKLFSQLDGIVRELRVSMEITPSIVLAWQTIKRDFQSSQNDIPPNFNSVKYNNLQPVILRRFPSEYYWRP
jgi:hypothetical protein